MNCAAAIAACSESGLIASAARASSVARAPWPAACAPWARIRCALKPRLRSFRYGSVSASSSASARAWSGARASSRWIRSSAAPQLRRLQGLRGGTRAQRDFGRAPREAWIARIAGRFHQGRESGAGLAPLHGNLGRHDLEQQRAGQFHLGQRAGFRRRCARRSGRRRRLRGRGGTMRRGRTPYNQRTQHGSRRPSQSRSEGPCMHRHRRSACEGAIGSPDPQFSRGLKCPNYPKSR